MRFRRDLLAKHPGVTIREVAVTVQGDARGGICAALMSGEVVDVIINTWPAFLATRNWPMPARCGRSTTNGKRSVGISSSASPRRDLGSISGTTYGLTYTYGDRSGIWFKKEHLAKAGITEPPKTWDEFLATFP